MKPKDVKKKPLTKHNSGSSDQRIVKKGPPKRKSGSSKSNRNIFIFIILVITAVVYFKTLNFDFTNWDDKTYLNENPFIKDLSSHGIAKIFSTAYFGNYHPLTTLSYTIEYYFFGLKPFIFHLINVLVHLVNCLLVFLLIKKLTNKIEIPLITAFIFALHPMHVESVAWVAERKDVLYTLYFLASLIFYIKFIKEKNNLKFLVVAFIFFILSLLSKSAAVTTPVIMLLTVYYINRKIIIKDFLLLTPFFILSLLFGIIAMKTQVEAIGNLNALYPGINRILIVTYGIYYYIVRFFIPFNLTTLHGFPTLDNGLLPFEYYIAPAIVLIIIALLFFIKKEFRHHLLFGLLFFFISLILVIQIIPVGQAVVAERYTYVPYIGLAFIVAYGYEFLQKYISRNILISFAVIYAVFLIATTWQQTKTWENSEILWTKVLKVYPDNQIAYNNRGLYRTEKGMTKEAFEDFNRLIAINPEYKDVYNNRATACFNIKDYNCVVKDLDQAITRKPNNSKLYNNRGLAKSYLKDISGAISDYNKAIELDTSNTDAFNNRINAKESLNDFEGAIKDISFLIKNDPKNAKLYNGRGILSGKAQHYPDALADFNQAINLDTKMAEAHSNKGMALLNMGRTAEACMSWQTSSNLGNKNANEWLIQYCKK